MKKFKRDEQIRWLENKVIKKIERADGRNSKVSRNHLTDARNHPNHLSSCCNNIKGVVIMPNTNNNLIKAKQAKNDEFYTYYEDIEQEMEKYRAWLKDKIIWMPCDNYDSNFWKFFIDKYADWGIKKLIATSLDNKKLIYDGEIYEEDIPDGDFRKQDYKECDIVITNPPFSLFRDITSILLAIDADFILIGNQNSFTYKEFCPYLFNRHVVLGSKVKKFYQPDGTIKQFGNIQWFSTVDLGYIPPKLNLTKTYNPTDYPKYENCDAIEVGRVANIPKDYKGKMGVPITFLEKWNPEQFDILGADKQFLTEGYNCRVDGKQKYSRLIIQAK